MKRKSISLKIVLLTILLTASLAISIIYLTVERERRYLEKEYIEKAEIMITSLENGISSYEELNDRDFLYTYLLRFIYLYSENDVVLASISLMENGELKVVASTNYDEVGNPAGEEEYISYESGKTVEKCICERKEHFLIVTKPLDLFGQRVGVIKLVLSMNRVYNEISSMTVGATVTVLTVSVIFILAMVFFLNKNIIKPLISIRNAAVKIGKGNFDLKIGIRSNDEIGELSTAFDKMVEEIKREKDRKEELLMQISHDLKTPLTPLYTLLPLIKERIKDPKIEEILDICIRNVEYMKKLITDSLQLLKTDKVELSIENLNLKREVEDILKNQRMEEEKKIDIRVEIDDDIFVRADRIRLREIFDNLISNAIKYSYENGLIEIGAEKDGEMVKIFVRDNGMGLDEEEKKRIFDEFYKVDKSGHDLFSTGVGLSICKRLVERHGGKIWVESEGIGKGSTFYFTLKSAR